MKIPTDLQNHWEEVLQKEGLSLKQKNNRTIRFQNKDSIRDFFLTLDCLITHNPIMDRFEKKVLLKYSSGMSVVQITKELRVSRGKINRVIQRYKGIVIAIQKMEASVQSAL